MEFVSLGLERQVGRIPIGFLPSQIPSLKQWNRFNTDIIETGSGVSQWGDFSGNGNHLKQAIDANRMTKEADGSVLGNGIDQFLQADTYTLVQPEIIFVLGRHLSWTSDDRWFDGNAADSGTLFQRTSTPNLGIFAGAQAGNISLALNTTGVVTVVLNGASSSIQLNNNAPVTGNAGTSSMSGFTLGAKGGGVGGFGNVQYQEVIVCSATLDTATIAQVINYLARVGGLSI